MPTPKEMLKELKAAIANTKECLAITPKSMEGYDYQINRLAKMQAALKPLIKAVNDLDDALWDAGEAIQG